MALQFGTDGLRGVANADLTPEVVLALGRAAARSLGAPAFLLGSDTRRSSAMLAGALMAGFTAEGADVIDVGVIPTPGLAWLAADRSLPAAMISASHNPFPDNGVKLISKTGTKLAVATERAVETELAALLAGNARLDPAPVGARIGRASLDGGAVEAYIAYLCASVDFDPTGRRVVVDCANGAASAVAPEVFGRLGIAAEFIARDPDGTNINADCGSTDLRALSRAVVERGADFGLGFDGDADRLVAVDANGAVIDGDRLLVLFALDLLARGELEGNGIVVTVMSNLGLHRALEAAGVTVVEVPVGDRNVVDALVARGLVFGGEQSGHIVFRRRATTGDGLLTALLLCELVSRSPASLEELAASAMTPVPQVLVNVAVAEPQRLFETASIWSEVARLETELGSLGRVVLRPSGTEQAVRVMVEALEPGLAERLAGELAGLVSAELGTHEA